MAKQKRDGRRATLTRARKSKHGSILEANRKEWVRDLKTRGWGMFRLPQMRYSNGLALENASQCLDREGAVPIFQRLRRSPRRRGEHNPHRGDGKRVSLSLENATFKELACVREGVESAMQECKEALPTLIPRDPVAILSYVGCQRQAPHADGNLDEAMERLADNNESLDFPCSAIISFQHNTTLLLWDGSHKVAYDLMDGAYDGEALHYTRVKVPKHHAVVFRSDLIHAGDEYTASNLRAHFYLDHPDIERVPDTTDLVPPKIYGKIGWQEVK